MASINSEQFVTVLRKRNERMDEIFVTVTGINPFATMTYSTDFVLASAGRFYSA